MNTASVDYLIFVEDPGAVNGVVGLPAVLQSRGTSFALAATGHAVDYLTTLGIACDPVGPDETASSLLSRYTPRGVLTGTSENPDSLGLELNKAAQKAKIPGVAFVDGPVSAEYRFRGRGDSPLAFAPDWVLAADANTGALFREFGFAPDKLHVCGHPYMDHIRAMTERLDVEGQTNVRRRVLPNAPTDRPVWTFVAELSDGIAPERFHRNPNYTLRGRGNSDNRTDIVLDEVLDALGGIEPRPYIVLRLHPKNHAEEFAGYGAEIDHVSSGGLPSDLIYGTDLVIGMTSILLTEAVVMGRPTVSVVPDPGEGAWLPNHGLIPVIHTRGDLRKLLSAALSDPTQLMGKPATDVIKFGATDRMADFLLDLIADQ